MGTAPHSKDLTIEDFTIDNILKLKDVLFPSRARMFLLYY
jgi:hypothetical protein